MNNERGKLLEHDLRAMIYSYITANPYADFQMISKVLKMNDGTLRYHLSVLVKSGMIKLKKTLMSPTLTT